MRTRLRLGAAASVGLGALLLATVLASPALAWDATVEVKTKCLDDGRVKVEVHRHRLGGRPRGRRPRHLQPERRGRNCPCPAANSTPRASSRTTSSCDAGTTGTRRRLRDCRLEGQRRVRVPQGQGLPPGEVQGRGLDHLDLRRRPPPRRPPDDVAHDHRVLRRPHHLDRGDDHHRGGRWAPPPPPPPGASCPSPGPAPPSRCCWPGSCCSPVAACVLLLSRPHGQVGRTSLTKGPQDGGPSHVRTGGSGPRRGRSARSGRSGPVYSSRMASRVAPSTPGQADRGA